jgi:RNA polymerase sigma factor (sigma-70 family)
MEDTMIMPGSQVQQSILYAVQNYGKRLFNFIRSRVQNDEDAEDILQDVWYQLSNIIDTEPIEQLSSWLYRVSRNRIIDKKRKKKTLLLEDFAYQDEDGEIVLPDDLMVDYMNPEIEFDNLLFKETLLKALSELPPKQREVFVMNEIEDLTLQEIADKSGESIKTIISRKRYAVKRLKKSLNNFYNEF